MGTVDAALHRRHRSRPQTARVDARRPFDLSMRGPAQPRGMVGRPALVRELIEAVDIPLVLIIAPPGYGKSTLLAEWASVDERPFLWLGRAAGFRQGAAAATAAAAAEADCDALARSVRELRSAHERFTVVLDDAHE